MDLQPTLQNDLLKLRPMEVGDYDALFTAANDPLIWEQHFDKRNHPDNFKRFFEEGLASGGALVVVHKNSNSIIGSSRYFIYEGYPGAVEIGWTFLARDYWGGMYNKMMKKLMIDHALKSKRTVYLFIDHHNYRSQKAALKIGAQQIPAEEKEKHPATRPTNLIFQISKD